MRPRGRCCAPGWTTSEVQPPACWLLAGSPGCPVSRPGGQVPVLMRGPCPAGVSVLSEGESELPPRQYRNVDGHRVEDGRYAAFMAEISSFVPQSRQALPPA